MRENSYFLRMAYYKYLLSDNYVSDTVIGLRGYNRENKQKSLPSQSVYYSGKTQTLND